MTEINEKITKGDAVVITAEEMVNYVQTYGAQKAASDIDVVTTGTFGCMCSSGAFFNMGQPDPPIKIEKVTLNDVEAYHGNAASDMYLGVTKMRPGPEMKYGGGHVFEDLLNGKKVHLKASAYGTDCYPRTGLEVDISLKDFNQAIMLNPRNGYQRYLCATNDSHKTIYTYMGKLLPNMENATFGGVGTLSPFNNDPHYRVIGNGTHIFIGGGDGYVIGEGTQHSPKSQFATMMLKGDMKKMSSEFVAGASITGYGTSCFLGIGVPIPILDIQSALDCSIPNSELKTSVVDYSTGTRYRPDVKDVSYEELQSGRIEVNNMEIRVSPTSSYVKSRKIANILKEWIENGKFLLSGPVEALPKDTPMHTMPDSMYKHERGGKL